LTTNEGEELMNRFLAAYLLARQLGRELKIAIDKDDYKDLRRRRRSAQVHLGQAANALRDQGWVS
jgi:predicted amidophosphoribosyltransferase